MKEEWQREEEGMRKKEEREGMKLEDGMEGGCESVEEKKG